MIAWVALLCSFMAELVVLSTLSRSRSRSHRLGITNSHFYSSFLSLDDIRGLFELVISIGLSIREH